MSQGKAPGVWRGATFAHRKELSTQFMALSAKATVSLSLGMHREVHKVHPDESRAFDKPLRPNAR